MCLSLHQIPKYPSYSFKMGHILPIVLFTLAGTIAGGGGVAINASQRAETSAMPPFKEHTECGGVVPLSTLYTTTIAYKQGQPFFSTEFCIWSLLPHSNVQSMRVEVTLESDSATSGLVAYFWDGMNLTSLQFTSDNMNSTFNQLPAFFAFTSNVTTTRTGIRILMTPEGGDIASLKGQVFHFNAIQGEFSYPGNRSSLNEPTSVVLPARAFFDGRDMKETKVTVNDLEVGQEYVSVYSLFYNWDPLHLRLLARLSGNDEGRYVTQYDDPVVMFFTSNQRTPGHGFNVQWGKFLTKQEL